MNTVELKMSHNNPHLLFPIREDIASLGVIQTNYTSHIQLDYSFHFLCDNFSTSQLFQILQYEYHNTVNMYGVLCSLLKGGLRGTPGKLRYYQLFCHCKVLVATFVRHWNNYLTLRKCLLTLKSLV